MDILASVLDSLAHRRPDVAFVSYAHWPTPVVAREPAWNVVPDLVIEIVSPPNLAEEIDRKITDYFQAGGRRVWVLHQDSKWVYVYQSPTHASIMERHLGRRPGAAQLWAAHRPIV